MTLEHPFNRFKSHLANGHLFWKQVPGALGDFGFATGLICFHQALEYNELCLESGALRGEGPLYVGQCVSDSGWGGKGPVGCTYTRGGVIGGGSRVGFCVW